MNGKDCLVVLLMVIIFFVVTFFMWTHYREIARIFFMLLFMAAMGVFAWGLWNVLAGSIRR